jgi:D-glycero-D-manno-heptose 1,7-bisphosphate phosphatase
MTRRAAVFLDRDGVLNESRVVDGVPRPPYDVSEFRLLPGVEEACRSFADAGLLLVVVTNQPDISRGALQQTQLDAMHSLLADALPLDDIVVCVHDDDAGCPCRKPRPGMILDAARRLEIDLDRSVGVGDRWRDVEAAHRAGVRSVYVDWGQPEPLLNQPDATFGSLLEAKEWIQAATGSPSGLVQHGNGGPS